jgi:SAM-dependent methyltransferase
MIVADADQPRGNSAGSEIVPLRGQTIGLMWKRWLADRLAPQINTFTYYRYGLIAPFLIRGPVRTLNIGTGGGLETLRMLRRGNHVTTIEIDEPTAASTRQRIVRNGYGERHVGYVGHVLRINLQERFHQIVMCEVLEHIEDDVATIGRLADWLLPGGRLILSTPTASYGQLPGSVVSPIEDGSHVRVGYDGPELDEMLDAAGFVVQRRVFNGNSLVRCQLIAEKILRSRRWLQPLGATFALVCRPVLPIMDCICRKPHDQITLAVKRKV